jgi:hypothetical protein
MARVLTSLDIDAAGGDPTARAQLAAIQALITGNASFFNSKRLYITDAATAAPINVLGITPQYNRIVGVFQDSGAGVGSGSFGCGDLLIKYSADNKGIENTYCKSRATGPTITPTVSVNAADVIFTELWYGDAGATAGAPTGSMAHVGWYRVGIDGAPTGDSTELPGWYGLATGSGLHVPGSRYAMAVNSKQQVHLPGAVSNVFGPTGTNWGAGLTLGVGAATAGGAPFKFTLTSAAILTAPEAGALEPDATGLLYFTNAAGKRGQIITADTTANTIAAGTGAGTGPTLTLVNGPRGGRITLITGTTPALSGIIATVTYGTAFPTDSFATFAAAGDNAAAAMANVRISSIAGSFNLKNVGAALTAATTYVWNFQYTGN